MLSYRSCNRWRCLLGKILVYYRRIRFHGRARKTVPVGGLYVRIHFGARNRSQVIALWSRVLLIWRKINSLRIIKTTVYQCVSMNVEILKYYNLPSISTLRHLPRKLQMYCIHRDILCFSNSKSQKYYTELLLNFIGQNLL